VVGVVSYYYFQIQRKGMNCDNCGKEVEELFGDGLFNGNKDDGWYCEDCYEKLD